MSGGAAPSLALGVHGLRPRHASLPTPIIRDASISAAMVVHDAPICIRRERIGYDARVMVWMGFVPQGVDNLLSIAPHATMRGACASQQGGRLRVRGQFPIPV
jgi:hypothetical protein